MKRIVCLILCLCLVAALSGCRESSQENTANFYYCRADYAYGSEEAIVAHEVREISANNSDLKNLLALYLVGPLDESLTTPFLGAKLLSVEKEDDQLIIHLTDNGETMAAAQFSLACGCMTMTCLELAEVSQVTIVRGERSVTMSRDNLLLHDSITPIEAKTEESQ